MRHYLRQVLAAAIVVTAFGPAYAGGPGRPGHGNGYPYHHYYPNFGGYYYGAWPYGYFVADYGPTVVVNEPPNIPSGAVQYASEEPPPPRQVVVRASETTAPLPAEIRIRTVPSAKVWIDGKATTQTGTVRNFATPPLESGQSYAYKVRACWLENGQPVVRSRVVRVIPGETAELDLR
jgi:uncharacterized protein (TIGR03000 family)